MKKAQLTALLTSFGLRDVEAHVYLAALSEHPLSVLELSRISGVKRTTIYSVLESLKQKGLVAEELKGKSKRIRAESPEQLEKMLEIQEMRLKNALPDLLSLFHIHRNAEAITYYDNIEAIKAGYRELMKRFKSGETYRVISHAEGWYNMDPVFFQKFLDDRKKAGINTRALLLDSPKARELKKFEKNYYEGVRLLPEGTELSTNLLITPDTVMIQQVSDPIFGIVTHNPSLITMHREMFDMVWRSQS